MSKAISDTPDADDASKRQNREAESPNDPNLDDEHQAFLADTKSTPRTPCSMYTVNPDIDVQTLLGCVSESLASASVITMDIADRETGPSRNSLLGIHQIIMLAEISVNRALDQLDPIE